MRRAHVLALAAVLAAPPVAAQQQDQQPAVAPEAPAVAPAPGDAPAAVQQVDAQSFVAKAMDLHNVEIGISRIARLKGVDAAVSAFADKMIADHTEAAAALAEAAKAAGIEVELGPDVGNQAYTEIYDRLSGAEGPEFTRLFVEAQKAAHEEAIRLYTSFSESGDNEALQTLATSTIPTLLEHQTDIGQLTQ